MAKVDAIDCISRSIGVPVCVPEAKYTPRSSARWSNLVEVKASARNSAIGSFRLATCDGKPYTRPRRSISTSCCRRSSMTAFSRVSSRSNSPSKLCAAGGVSARPSSTGKVMPQTCSRSARFSASKNSTKPATRSALVNTT